MNFPFFTKNNSTISFRKIKADGIGATLNGLETIASHWINIDEDVASISSDWKKKICENTGETWLS